MCLTEATLRDLVSGALSDSERAAAHEHLRTCEICTEALEDVRLGLDDGLATKVARARPPSRPEKAEDSRPPTTAEASSTISTTGPTAAPEKIGPYVLLERIGEGGMGAVYTAYHPELDRKVAIKLLRPENSGDESEADLQVRLLREAQAMARLDHPNVVAVHDAGEYKNKVYLVMDRVEGVTLSEWLAAKRRSWREVVAAFAQAGRGLAAAHAAGLVHRDFKPANVLIGQNGRVRVTDFGLARAVGQPAEGVAAPPSDDKTPVNISSPLTEAGTILGTPRYMAPEQSLGEPGDPRADQFSFCVALYEALYGERPFDKPSDALSPQKISDPPASATVPRFLRRALLRGFSAKPGDRFESMDALLVALGQDPARRVWLALAGVAAVALVVAVILLGVRAFRPAIVVGCEDPGKALAGIWDQATRQHISAALAQAGASGVDMVAHDLDQYASTWTALHRTACERVTTARGDETVLLELTCLARQKTDLEALVGVLGHADTEIATHVGLATRSLVPPSRCADARGLAALPKPSPDPRVRAEVEELRLRMAAASFEAAAGKPKAATEQLTSIVERAHELGHGPLEAEALYALGLSKSFQGNMEAAKVSMREAEKVAEASGADLVAAEAAASLGLREAASGHLAEGKQALERARARVERVGGDPYVEGLIENTAASFQDQEDDQLVQHSERAVKLFEEALGPVHPRTVMYRGNLGISYDMVGRFDDAVKVLPAVLQQMAEEGARGAQTVDSIVSLADSELRLGQLEEAELLLVRSELNIDPAGREINAWQAELLEELALVRRAQGRVDEALELARHAEQVAIKSYGPESENYGVDLALEGELLEEKGKHAEAARLLKRADEIFVKGAGPNTFDRIDPLGSLAAAEVALGHWKEALGVLDRAFEISKKHRLYRGQAAALKLTHAKVMLAKRDRGRASTSLAEARAELAEIPWKRRELQALETWAHAKRLK